MKNYPRQWHELTMNKSYHAEKQSRVVTPIGVFLVLLVLLLPYDQIGFEAIVMFKVPLIVFLILLYLFLLGTLLKGSMVAKAYYWSLAVMLFFALASFYHSDSFLKSVRIFGALFIGVSAFLVASNLLVKEKYYKLFIKIVFVNGLLMSLYGLVQYSAFLYGQNLGVHIWAGFIRVTGFFGDPNLFGNYLLSVLPLLGTMLLYDKRRKYLKNRALLMTIILALVTVLILTFSRSAWIAAIVSGLVLVGYGSDVLRRLWHIAFILTVAVLIVVNLGPISIEKVRERAIDVRFESPVNLQRVEIYKAGLEMIAANPFIGVGIGNFLDKSYEHNPDIGGRMIAHNSFLEMGAEIGILGLLSFILFLGVILWRAFRVMRADTISFENKIPLIGGVGSLVALITQSFFITSLYFLHFWVTLAFVCGVTTALMKKSRGMTYE